MRFLILLVVTLLSRNAAGVQLPQYWKNKAHAEMERAKNIRQRHGIAKNVILFIGDGMSLSTVTASRILKGQLKGETGEEDKLVFEEFPHVALAKPYLTDRQVADSAGSINAIVCGVKTKYYTTGIDDNVIFRDCSTQQGNELTSILDWSQDVGKSAGIVTTARITHATPAGCYAHAADRDWEGDAKMEGVPGTENCKDIAYQLVRENRDIKVLFGGGRRFFMNMTTPDPHTNTIDQSNQRRDGRDLIQEWKNDKASRNLKHKYAWNTETFSAITADDDYALGLFKSSHMSYDLERDKSTNGEPSLEEMTRKAIQILKKNDKGFFLMVEGARIDHAHHDNLAKLALYETLALEKAVKAAVDLTNEDDTTIIVTPDHSFVLNVAGYGYRGNDILGLVNPLEYDNWTPDNFTFTTLQYGNGPGYDKGIRKNLTNVDTTANNYTQVSAVPTQWATHDGEDVPIYARGPMAWLFHGVHEQNYIAHVMAYASCVGDYDNEECRQCREQTTKASVCRAATLEKLSQYLVIAVLGITISFL